MPEIEGDAVPAQSKGSWSSFLKVRSHFITLPQKVEALLFTDSTSPLPHSMVTWHP